MDFLYTIIIYPITQIIEFVFVFAQKLLKDTGIAIICVSGAVNIICLPLYMIAEHWQEVERGIQKKLQDKIKKIKAVFKGDERFMILSTYYRQNNYHPVYALRSTFGLLIQIPFFIAAFSYLSNLELLQGTRFLFISNLGQPDRIIPIAGGINLLPILMTAVNLIAGAIYVKGFNVKEKIQLYGMALIFLVLLYNSPSGLVLYWTINNVFSLFKNAYLKISYAKKHFFLYGLISLAFILFSFYTIFFHYGNMKTRVLIAIISIFTGLLPWIIPPLMKLFKKIKIVSWSSRETLFLFITSILVLFSATGIFVPSMLIGASPQEFSYIDNYASPNYFIGITALQAFGLFIFWPLMIYLLFSEKVKKFLSIFMFIITLGAICNIFIFHGNYGPISNDLIFTNSSASHDLSESAINFAVLIAISSVLIFLYMKGFRKTLISFCAILFLALTSFSIKNVFNINSEFKKLSEYYTPENKTINEITPIFHLSKTGKNVIVIMLDMAQSVFIPYIFDESPELSSKYEGFTYYPNTVTFNGWTMGGAPGLFGGYEYTPLAMNSNPDLTFWEKSNQSLLMMPRLFSSEGYSVIITDPPYAASNWIPDLRIYDNESNVSGYITDSVYTDYWLAENNLSLPSHSGVLKRNVLWYSIFREMPLIIRKEIYFSGSWCAPVSEYKMRRFLNGYSVLDNMRKLTDFSSKNENTALIMVNNTTHESLLLEAPDYKPATAITTAGKGRFGKEAWYHINAAAIKRLSDFFDFLKANDAYDNSRIILVSDHGCLDATYVTKTSLPFPVDQFNPVLLFKDFDSTGEMKTDMAFMTNADVPFLAVNGLIDNPANPFTGKIISNDQKNNPQLILIKRVSNSNPYDININIHNSYYVKDNIFDEKNWSRPAEIP